MALIRVVLLALMMVLPLSSHAVFLSEVPAEVPAQKKAALKQERQQLFADKKALSARIARNNDHCARKNLEKHLIHKCSVDRQELLKQMDKHDDKVLDFNRRVAEAAKPAEVSKP